MAPVRAARPATAARAAPARPGWPPRPGPRVVDDREVGVLRAAAGGADPGGADPARGVPGDVLLEERAALDAVGPADHRHRAVAQVRQHHVGDGQVVGQHVGLGGAGERVEHLARVGQLRPPEPRPVAPGAGAPPASGSGPVATSTQAGLRVARLVGRVGALGDAPRAGPARPPRPAPRARRRGTPAPSRQCGPCQRQALQQRPPLAERQLARVAAVEVQQVADPQLAAVGQLARPAAPGWRPATGRARAASGAAPARRPRRR